MTDYVRKQGETLKFTIEMETKDGYPVKLANSAVDPLYYFLGTMTNGTTEIAFAFKYGASETRTSGKGAGEITDTGIFKVTAYISADDLATIAVGDWTYAIRMSETENPVTTDNVRIISEGDVKVEASKTAIAAGTTYLTPSA